MCNRFPLIGGSDKADGLHMVYQELSWAVWLVIFFNVMGLRVSDMTEISYRDT